jgi:hypothetical protein
MPSDHLASSGTVPGQKFEYEFRHGTWYTTPHASPMMFASITAARFDHSIYFLVGNAYSNSEGKKLLPGIAELNTT